MEFVFTKPMSRNIGAENESKIDMEYTQNIPSGHICIFNKTWNVSGVSCFFFNSSDKKSIFRKGENRENYELKAYRAIVLRSLINKPIFLVVANKPNIP